MSRHDAPSPIPTMSRAAMSSDGEESCGNDTRPKKPTLAKRLKYDLTKIFSVLAGAKPHPQRFTVHHDLITKSSEFFRAARAKCWTEPGKVDKLFDDDPVVFSAYLSFRYFGADYGEKKAGPRKRGESLPDDDNDKDVDPQRAEYLENVRFIIDVYLMADKSLDPSTANVVMRELVTFVHIHAWVTDEAIVNYVYASTTENSPLRTFVRDWWLFSADRSWAEGSKPDWKLPLEFLQDLIVEMARLRKKLGQGSDPIRTLGMVCDAEKYLQKVEQVQ